MGAYDDLIPGAGPSRRTAYDDLLPGGAPAATVQPAEAAAPAAVDTPSPGILTQARDFVSRAMPNPSSLRFPFGRGEGVATAPGSRPRSVFDEKGNLLNEEVPPGTPGAEIGPAPPDFIPAGSGTRLEALKAMPRVGGATFAQGIAGLVEHAADLAGAEKLSGKAATVAREQSEALGRATAPFTPIEGSMGERGVPFQDRFARLPEWFATPENIANIGQQAPQLAGTAAALLGAPMALTLGTTLSAPVWGQAYHQYKQLGYDTPAATLGAFGQMATETVPEVAWIKFTRAYKLGDVVRGINKMAPADQAKAITGLLKGYGIVGASELGNELTSTAGNDLVDYLMQNPNMSWDQLGKDLAQTVQQIGPVLPVMGGIAHAGRALAQRGLETSSGRATVLADELRRAVEGTDLPRTDVSPLAPTTEPTIAAQQRPPIEGVVTGRQVEPAPAAPAVPSVLAGQAAPVPPAVPQPAPEQAPPGPMVPPEQAFQRLAEAHPDAGLTMVAPADVPADQRRTAALVTSALDKRVIFVRGDPAIYEGSMFTDAPHTFFVNIDSPRAWRKLLSHETFHTLRQTNPAVYDELHRAVLQVVSTGPAAQRYNERYGATAATRQEEMLADMYGDFMDDPKFLVEVFRASKAPLVERIYQGVRQALNSVYQRLTRGGTSYQTKSLITDLDAARKAFAKAYVAWQAAPHEAAPGGITQADMARMESKAGTRATIDERSLPMDMKVLLQDVWEIAGSGPVPKKLPLVQIPIDRFPNVRLPGKMSGDDRGRPRARAMAASTDQLPPVVVVGDDWIDGRHRVVAARMRGDKFVPAIDLGAAGATWPTTASPFIGRLKPAAAQSPHTPEFQKWFTGSKVVDEQGQPLVVFHGTASAHTTFDLKHGGLYFDNPVSRTGFFFVEERHVAEDYARTNAEDLAGKGQPRVVAAYLSLKNPVVIDASGYNGANADHTAELAAEIEKAKRDGFDGAIIGGWQDGSGAETQYVAFRPNQIKDVTNKRPTQSPHIMHSEPGARIPIATDILDTIDHEVKRAGGIKDRAGAADIVDALAEHHEQELLAMMDKIGPDKRPTILLHKGDLASGTPTVWLLGWSTKEGTDIHDHAGSQVGVHVLRGSVRERVYGVRGNKVARLEARNNPAGVDALQSERDLRVGSTLALADPYIHEVFGHSEGAQRDVTVHAYFPPLTKMTYFTYDEASGKLKYDGEWDEAQPPSEADKIRKSQPGLRDFTPEASRVSVGLEPGAGVTAKAMAPITAEKLARDLAELTSIKILRVEHGQGAYLGQAEGSMQLDVSGSPEAVLDYITAIGYAARQSSVISTRPIQTGKQMAIDIESRELTDGGVAQEFFAALHAVPGLADLAPGYQQSAQGLRLLNFAGRWSAEQLAVIEEGLNIAAEKTGVPIVNVVKFAVSIQEAVNDWQGQTQGETYLDSLRDRGRAALAEQLVSDYGQRAPPPGAARQAASQSQPGERVSPLEGSPAYKAAQQAAEKYFGDYAAARTAYEALPETDGGRILNPDLAAELVAEYRNQRELAAAVHDAASKFVKAYYAEKLTQETPEKLDGRVIFTAGGPGSGKSTAVRKAVGESADQAEMYYDSMLSRFDSAKARIDAALESGRPVQVIFVDRSPGPAYAGTIQRVLAGYRRIVPIGEHARGHVEARKVFRQLLAAYAGDERVDLIAIDNTDGLDAIKPIASEQIGPWEYTAAYEAALRVTEEANAKGYLSDAQVYAATGRTAAEVRSLVGSRAVAEPATERGTGRASSPGPRPASGAAAGAGRAAVNWNAEQPGVADNLTRALQDQVVDLKRVQDAIREAGGVIQALNDPYLTEELAKSRYANRIKTFDKALVEPLLQDLKSKGITAAELDRFLWARHAPEANAQLAKINPGLQNASGMSDAEAAQVIADFGAKGVLGKLTALATRIDAMTASTRKLYVDEKLESQKTIDLWQSIYKNYVPLQREIENPQPGPGQGFKIRGPESKRRMGSQRAVVGITAAVIAKHHNAIIRAEKAHVGRDLIKLAEEFPNPDFWRVDSPPMQRYVNPSSGLVEMRVDPLYKMSPDVFVVKDANANGDIVERVLAFNPLDERALALSRSMQKLDVVEQGAIVRTVGMATRYMANLATQWNPVFWATNLARDVGTMAINLQSTPLKGMAPRVMSRMPDAMAGIASATWGNGTGKYATLWKEAQEEGMPTGWYKNFENILERQKELEKMVKQAGQGSADPRVWARWSAEQISNVNSMIENSTRLAVYSVARDQGSSKREAASIAKNITVNFDRKGNASTAAGAWYMFFNANVQGGVRLAQGLNDSPRARAMVGLMAALGAAMEVINMLIGDHDKDEAGNNPYEILGAYEKQRNWIFMVPKSWGIGDPITDEKQQIVGRYFKFPLPYGFNIFPTAGRIAAEAVMSRIKPGLYSEKRGPLDLAADFGNVVVDAFSPLGSASTAIQTIAPTIIDPFVQVFENKKWTGTPMVPDRSMQKALPRSSLYFTNNSETAKDLAAWLNRASGGDELTPGWLNLYPGHIEHVFRTLTGGPGTFSMGMFDWGTNITQRALGHDVEPTKTSSIPFVGKFYGEVDERAIEAKFYRIKGQADETYARYRAYKKAGDIDAADKLEQDQPQLIEFARAIAKSQFRKDQKELREEVKGTRELPVIDRAAAKLQIKRDQSRLYQEALEAYNAAASEGR